MASRAMATPCFKSVDLACDQQGGTCRHDSGIGESGGFTFQHGLQCDRIFRSVATLQIFGL